MTLSIVSLTSSISEYLKNDEITKSHQAFFKFENRHCIPVWRIEHRLLEKIGACFFNITIAVFNHMIFYDILQPSIMIFAAYHGPCFESMTRKGLVPDLWLTTQFLSSFISCSFMLCVCALEGARAPSFGSALQHSHHVNNSLQPVINHIPSNKFNMLPAPKIWNEFTHLCTGNLNYREKYIVICKSFQKYEISFRSKLWHWMWCMGCYYRIIEFLKYYYYISNNPRDKINSYIQCF